LRIFTNNSNCILGVTWTFLMIILAHHTYGQYYERERPKKSVRKFYERGLESMAEEDFSEALHYFNKTLGVDPYFFDAYLQRAFAKQNLKDYEGAVGDYTILLNFMPDFREALFGRGLNQYLSGHYGDAKKDLEKLFKLPENETNAIYYEVSNAGGGISGVSTLKNLDAEIYNYLSLISSQLGDTITALRNINLAIAENPGEPNYYVNRALIREGQGYLEGAADDYSTALKIDPYHSQAGFNLIKLAGDIENHTALIEDYTKIINENPAFAEAYAQRAYLKYLTEDYSGAVSDYTKALDLDENLLNLVNRGIAKSKLEDWAGAISDFNNALMIDPKYISALSNRGNIYAKIKNYEAAINDYTIVLYHYPNDPVSHYNRGIAYYETGDPQLACSDIKKALDLGLKRARKAWEKLCQD